MNGNFEKNLSAWPISYMYNGSTTADGLLYNIVDLRGRTEPIHSANMLVHEIAPIVGELNNRLRSGKYEEDYDLIKRHAALLCGTAAELTEAAPTADAAAQHIEEDVARRARP